MKAHTYIRAAAVMAAVALAVLPATVRADTVDRWEPGPPTLVDDPPGRMYTYAPSVIREGSTLHVWSCHNADDGVVRDHVYHTVRENGRTVSSTSVLGPDAAGTWDSFHICDPSVVAGRFDYDGVRYRYAMFFLGNNVNASANNQIGVAFANEIDGPWTRYPDPVVTYPPSGAWGVGQPSSVSADMRGRVMLFYTHGAPDGTYGLWQRMDLSDMAHPDLGTPQRVPVAGLTRTDGRQDVLNDFDAAYDPASDRYYIVRDQHPNPPDNPRYISGSVQVASIAASDLENGTGSWRVEGEVSPDVTGFPRNHDAGLVRSKYGRLPDHATLSVVFASSCAGSGCGTTAPLWTYDLWQVTGRLH